MLAGFVEDFIQVLLASALRQARAGPAAEACSGDEEDTAAVRHASWKFTGARFEDDEDSIVRDQLGFYLAAKAELN